MDFDLESIGCCLLAVVVLIVVLAIVACVLGVFFFSVSLGDLTG